MKSIILISSLFYLLGLKIGHKIDLVKKVNPIKSISVTSTVKTPQKTCDFIKESAAVKPACDSVIGGSSHSDALLKNIEF